MTRSLRVLALVLVAALPSPSQARCAPRGTQVHVLTPPTVDVPLDGTFVVALRVSDAERGSAGGFPDGLSIRSGAGAIDLELTPLAPGLARARPTRAPSPGEWTLAGARVAPGQRVRFARGARLAALPPLSATGVSAREVAPASRRAPAHHEITATLARAIPRAVAFALVTSSGNGSWMPVSEPSTTIRLYPRRGRCDRWPSGFTPLRPGASARLVAIDAYGRVSQTEVAVQ